MSRTLTRETVGYLDRELGSRHPNRDFVEAVIRHLASSGSGFTQAGAADAVVALVTGRYNRGEAGLRDQPSLLASLFQNADLLDRSDPGSLEVIHMVMDALGGTYPSLE